MSKDQAPEGRPAGGERRLNAPLWSWPEPPTTDGSSTSLGGELEPEGSQDGGVGALRAAIVAVVAAGISTMATFGLALTPEQSAAVIGLVTAVSALVSLLVSRSRRRREA